MTPESSKPAGPGPSPCTAEGCTCGGSPTGIAEQVRAALVDASVAVIVSSEDLELIWANQAAEKFLRMPVKTVVDEVQRPNGGPEWQFFDTHGERYDFMLELRRCVESRTPDPPRVVGSRRGNGGLRWADSEMIPVPECQCGARWNVVSIFTDMTERRFTEETLHRLAFTDPLTGLPNRAVLNDRLEQTLSRARRSGVPSSLFFFDLDRFKLVNDEFGHETGDKVLRVVAKRLISAFRPEDTVARTGGDEFVVLTEGLGNGETQLARVREVVEGPATVAVDGEPDRRVNIALSIGTVQTEGSRTPSELLAAADAAMYEDKRRATGHPHPLTTVLSS